MVSHLTVDQLLDGSIPSLPSKIESAVSGRKDIGVTLGVDGSPKAVRSVRFVPRLPCNRFVVFDN